jgi:hypothetical protein
MAIPPPAVSLHVIASYVLLHALAATVGSHSRERGIEC